MHCCKLVTIVTESVLESRLAEDCQRLGARGFTVTDARGGSLHGNRRGNFEFNGNIRMEVLCAPEVATRLLEHLGKVYDPHYHMVAWSSDVSMLD